MRKLPFVAIALALALGGCQTDQIAADITNGLATAAKVAGAVNTGLNLACSALNQVATNVVTNPTTSSSLASAVAAGQKKYSTYCVQAITDSTAAQNAIAIIQVANANIQAALAASQVQ